MFLQTSSSLKRRPILAYTENFPDNPIKKETLPFTPRSMAGNRCRKAVHGYRFAKRLFVDIDSATRIPKPSATWTWYIRNGEKSNSISTFGCTNSNRRCRCKKRGKRGVEPITQQLNYVPSLPMVPTSQSHQPSSPLAKPWDPHWHFPHVLFILLAKARKEQLFFVARNVMQEQNRSNPHHRRC